VTTTHPVTASGGSAEVEIASATESPAPGATIPEEVDGLDVAVEPASELSLPQPARADATTIAPMKKKILMSPIRRRPHVRHTFPDVKAAALNASCRYALWSVHCSHVLDHRAEVGERHRHAVVATRDCGRVGTSAEFVSAHGHMLTEWFRYGWTDKRQG